MKRTKRDLEQAEEEVIKFVSDIITCANLMVLFNAGGER